MFYYTKPLGFIRTKSFTVSFLMRGFQYSTLLLLLISAFAANTKALTWEKIQEEAHGQTVYWNAWGGSEEINDYISWVARRVKEEHGVELKHVKLSNTSDAVSRVLAEKTAGRTKGGTIDLIWINGENFARMKQNNLLFGPFGDTLPNSGLIDYENKPTTLLDFHIPVDGMESPWGMAKFNFVYDSAQVKKVPDSIPGLLNWARSRPGRVTYPHVTDFLGSTFLLQVLIELAEDATVLSRAVEDEAQFGRVTKPLWNFLEELHPHLWRKGRSFPASNTILRQMLDDGEVDLSLSFNPSDTSSAIANGTLPQSARTFVLRKGTIGNTHFVAIPFNSSVKEGAMVVADFLLSAEAQAHKQDPRIWGDGTVLSMNKLNSSDRLRFEKLPLGVATLPPDQLGPTQPNPHPDWKNRIDAEWVRRYGQ